MTTNQLIRTRILEAATVNIEDGIVKCVLITEGLGNLRDKNYYTSEALQASVDLFNGVQCYLDHPGRDEEQNRPERSTRDLVGTFYDVEVGDIAINGATLKALLAKLKVSDTEAGRTALELIKHSLEVAKQFPDKAFIGLSINATGESEPSTINDMAVNLVKKFNSVFSVDVVTKPGARGGFLEAADKAVHTVTEAMSNFFKGKPKKKTLAQEMSEYYDTCDKVKKEVTPEGFENVVKALKKKPEITQPYAVAWWMKGQGYEPKAAEAMVDIKEQMEAIPSSLFGVLTLGKGKTADKKPEIPQEVEKAMEALRPVMSGADDKKLMEAAYALIK